MREKGEKTNQILLITYHELYSVGSCHAHTPLCIVQVPNIIYIYIYRAFVRPYDLM